MASVSTDPQRLIAVSLSKIHAARGQRGGVNLHKNLLVAGVIMKARSVYMMGLQGKASASPEPESEEKDIEESDEEEEQVVEAPVVVEDTTDGLSAPVVMASAASATDEAATAASQQQPEPAVLDLSCFDCDKENSPPGDSNTDMPTSCPSSEQSLLPATPKDNELASCQRCTKRRLAEDCDVNNLPSSKRARISSSSPASQSEVCQLTDSSTQCEPEPIQTDNAQISNLVHRFNSGLTGFLSCSANLQDNTSSADNSTEIHQKDSHSVSCSSQIKEAFETLARPVALALSV